MALIITRINDIYSSETAFVSGLLLAVGLMAATTSMWVRLAA